MAAPSPFNRVPPSGPPLASIFGAGAILQYDTRRTENTTEGVGPDLDTAPGTLFPVAAGIPPRIGTPRAPNSRLLVEFGCSLRLIDWDAVPTVTALMQVSLDEGGIWLTLSGPEYEFVAIADTGGSPALQIQKVWMRGQSPTVPSGSFAGASDAPTVIARVMLSVSAETPPAAIYADPGEAYISLFELDGIDPVPAP